MSISPGILFLVSCLFLVIRLEHLLESEHLSTFKNCSIPVVSNYRSQPVLISWFRVQGDRIIPLTELHQMLSLTLTNPGDRFEPGPLKKALPDAIQVARSHMEDADENLGGLYATTNAALWPGNRKSEGSFNPWITGQVSAPPASPHGAGERRYGTPG